MKTTFRDMLVAGLAGAALAVVALYLGGIIYWPMDNHDEPIIIEEGSIKVDFDRNNDTPDDPGRPVGDSIIRWDADPAVRVRLWVNGKEKTCNGEKCLLGGDSLSLNGNGRPISFVWNERKPNKPDKHGLGMNTALQRFHSPDPKYPSRFESEDKALKVNAVEFRDPQGKKQEISLRSKPEDVIAIQICFADDPAHCPDFIK